MTDTKSVEDRLRRTFQVVADQPVPPIGEDTRVRPSPASRARLLVRPVAVVLAVAVVASAVVLALVFGPRSGPGVEHPNPATQPTGTFQAIFNPTRPATSAELTQDASAMMARLRSVVGVIDFKVSVEGQSLVLSGPHRLSQADINSVATTATLFLRPVLCGAPPYSPGSTGTSGPTTAPLLSCGVPYQTTRENLGVTPNAGGGGYTEAHVPPDPALGSIPSTPAQGDDPSSTVLLPHTQACCQFPRYVLGPAVLNVSKVVASAQAKFIQNVSLWAVAITLKSNAASTLDSIARQSFHALIGFDFGGLVQSDDLIEPEQTTFSSLGGHIQITYASESQAHSEAALLATGPMSVPLKILAESFTSPALAHPAP